MVHHSTLALSAAQRKCLEEGGGTKETTNILRKTYGVNFEQYILSREEEWCKLPYSAPEWWDGNERGEPRFMEELEASHGQPTLGKLLQELALRDAG